ncbi:MAG: hypothetical protein QOI89_42 [Solirubrobacteraceae bacterium]|jgi:hypothetical protein|nr:hypothetical protein [Solirubrobacteraceae bacterium]
MGAIVRRKRNPGGGGRTGHPRSLANLKRGNNDAPLGNTQTVRHGGYAQVAAEALDMKAREVYDALAADAPLRAADGSLPSHDAVVVRLLADTLCRLDSLGAWLAGRWATEQARPALELEMRLRTQALDLAESMGMTPRSRSRIGLDLVRAEVSMSDTLADGAEAWRRRAEDGGS